MDFYYNGIWRMDWGLGNPNKTATLIACLMIAVWSIALVWDKGFWPALVLFTGLAWCLIQTYSRGGMVALFAGIAVLLFWIPRPWPRARLLGVVAALWLLGGFVLFAKAQTRYGQGLFAEDQSIHHRLVIWKYAPQMMAAAPWGWGLGKAGDAYTQWFQPFDESQNYLNLVNSHFNFMVEAGWFASAVYLFAWLAIFLLCRPSPHFRWKAIPLAIWVAFGVGACFSHVEESIWLWILPVGALLCVIWERVRVCEWPSVSSLVLSGAFSVGAVVMLVAVGAVTASQPITCSRGWVTVGKGPMKTVIFVDRHVMGSLYGHTFRKFVAVNHDNLFDGSYCFVESSRDLPPFSTTCAVVSGRFAGKRDIIFKLAPGTQMILVNPVCSPDEAMWDRNLTEKTTVYFGEYFQAPARALWSNVPGIRSRQIEGASDFVPSWPEVILSTSKI